VKTWLVDAGPLIAYLDEREPQHERVAERLEAFDGHLATTSAVITETMHFVAAGRRGPRRLADLVSGSAMDVFDFSRPPELNEAVALMEKYADTPMDYADATLVLLAEALDVRDVLTLDVRGFSTYRTRAARPLRLVLEPV
jgi:uncharacterized protein